VGLGDSRRQRPDRPWLHDRSRPRSGGDDHSGRLAHGRAGLTVRPSVRGRRSPCELRGAGRRPDVTIVYIAARTPGTSTTRCCSSTLASTCSARSRSRGPRRSGTAPTRDPERCRRRH